MRHPCAPFPTALHGKLYSSGGEYTFVGDVYIFIVRCSYIHRTMNILSLAGLS